MRLGRYRKFLQQAKLLNDRPLLDDQRGPVQAALQERYDDFDDLAWAQTQRARQACRSVRWDGCVRLGAIYSNGDNNFVGLKFQLTQPDWTKALCPMACENDWADGCYRCADLFRYGDQNNEATADKYLARACALGLQTACKE